jgi:hypothetical protein
LPYYLAIVGVPILLWELWTVIAWLADGPHQITQFRDTSSLNWYLAHGLEAITWIVALPMLVYVVRGCRRKREFLTFDMMFVLCGMSLTWTDAACNFFQPTFFASSNFINLNYMLGHMPFIVNPDAGRLPDPIFWGLGVEGGCMLALAVIAGRLISRARIRWPGISTAKLLGIMVLFAAAVELMLEIPAVAAGLWSYGAGPSLPLGHFGYAWLELLGGTGVFFIPALRVFKDDKGRSFLERGLERLRPGVRKGVTMLAMYAVMQLLWGAVGNIVLVGEPYAPKPRHMPAYTLNGMCDAPGTTGTRYGPCPGSPGYRMPGRHSLPGKSP